MPFDSSEPSIRLPMLHRRHAIGALVAGAASAAAMTSTTADESSGDGRAKFQLGYAPHPGMFKNLGGESVVQQIHFAADEGFTAFEYNGLPDETEAMQTEIGKALQDRGMQMGVFVAYANFIEPTFANPTAAKTTEILDAMKMAVEVAGRVGAKWFTVVPGSIDQPVPDEGNRYGGPRLAEGYQMANVIDMLRKCVEIVDPHDLVMVLEPLNWHANHGGTFLRDSDQAYAICRAVDSPACKILFDIYHQQITEGNLIPNIDACWSEIAYFQAGDNPGRKEPYTGEINYRNVFAHLHEKGFDGVIGMEHGNSQKGADGERAVIDAYRRADDF